LSYNPVPKIGTTLSSDKTSVRKNGLWTLGSLPTTKVVAKHLLSYENVIKTVMELTKDIMKDMQQEACYVLADIASRRECEDLKEMMKFGLVDALVELLGEKDAPLLKIVLEGVESFVRLGKEDVNDGEGNKVAERLELGGVEKLKSLQIHQDKRVYKMALRLVEDYFGREEEDG